MFYIGKRKALYYKRENGSLTRFGLRLTPEGLQVFDQLSRKWYPVPGQIPVLSGGHITIEVKVTDA